MFVMPVPLTTSRCSVPVPRPVLTVTVHVVPEPLTPATDAAVMPLVATAKLPAVTPVTASLNVSVYVTVSAIVGLVHGAHQRHHVRRRGRRADGEGPRHCRGGVVRSRRRPDSR